VSTRGRARGRDGPAARARQAGQRPLGHRPEELHAGDLRPARVNHLRAVQRRPAGPALRRRRSIPLIVRVRVKISGRLRSEARTRNRYAIRGYLDTARKHRTDIMAAIRGALAGNPWMPPLPA